MTGLFPAIEPYEHGMLAAGDGNLVYWETCGNPRGKPAVVVHGGPGSGCTDWQRRLFDPTAYRVALFDQRGCGRSTPHASADAADLTSNTTWHLVDDMERLRRHLGIERWLVLGGSWGSTLALAYAVRFPERVTEMILFGVTTGRHAEFDWLFRGGVAVLFPEQWDRLRAAAPLAESDRDVVDAYHRLLFDPDAAVQRRAAHEWCLWESATPAWPPVAGLSARFRDSRFALAFARLVTHYVRHNAWLEDGCLLAGAGVLADIPGLLVNGRFDFQAPISNAWTLHRAWPRSELVIVDDAGHADGAIARALTDAASRFLDSPRR
ncbi:MAG: prolyl aminopeptidase [Spirochaetaceae bacterium]|nr:prolyl aminopeptidase [Spirochaetaceae bacterium]